MKRKLYYTLILFFLGIIASFAQLPGQAKITYEIPYHNQMDGSYCTEYKVEIRYKRNFGEIGSSNWVELL